jgi:hypothetical protein
MIIARWLELSCWLAAVVLALAVVLVPAPPSSRLMLRPGAPMTATQLATHLTIEPPLRISPVAVRASRETDLHLIGAASGANKRRRQ